MPHPTPRPLTGKARAVRRRTLLRTGLGLGIGGGVLATTAAASAETGVPKSGPRTSAVTGGKVRNLSGPAETGRFVAPWTDLGIPVRCPDGSMLFVCGDTFDGDGVPELGEPSDWRAPVGLRSSSTDLGSLVVDGCVVGDYARSVVPEGHIRLPGGYSTAIPSDVFRIGDTLYMHLMRGVIYRTHHSDFWRSTDNGVTWEYLCQWPGDQYGGQFQQKTYAVADDGYCYVLSTVFNREIASDLLLHRVRHDQVGVAHAYQPWGYANGRWGWGNPPTSVSGRRKWGEICFRAMRGRYAFTWLNMDPLWISTQIFDLPTSNLFQTREQPIIHPTAPGWEWGNRVAHPYGGFIVPGSTFDNFHVIVSQWYDAHNYRIMHYRINGLEH